ncbi:MAG: guanylate kinase [Lachnospiraceae bacterium]|nr:guanylate kinase [Lachnospiraceae bacterium]
MHHIFCIMGKSASGKDTIYARLLADPSLRLHRIVPYTTRPMREGEEEGREYCFVSTEQFRALQAAGRIIEERCYHTVYGDWYYFTADDGQIRLEEESCLTITTLKGFRALKKRFGAAAAVPLFITLDEGERLARALERERRQAEPKYEEMCRRSLADAADFSPRRLAAAGIGRDDTFENDDLERCIAAIRERIAACLRGDGGETHGEGQ